jgi:hypothetical protein
MALGGLLVMVAFYMERRFLRVLVLGAGLAAMVAGRAQLSSLAEPEPTSVEAASPVATGNQDREEILRIRREIAGMPLGDNLRVYFLRRLDPHLGFPGIRSEPSNEAARATLIEAQLARRK